MTEDQARGATPLAAIDYFDRYLLEGFDKIEGWPGKKASVEFMKKFRELFSFFGEKGGVCEIGVHHAKYFIALHNVMENSKSLGLDVFEEQESNIDHSGKGVYDVSKANIDKYACNPHLIALRKADSIALKEKHKQDIVNEFGLFSMFSIDGGHTSLHVINDFMTASELTSRNGMIIVDDIFHPDWPGVTEGIYRILGAELSPFVPFMLTRKKLFLCSLSRQKKFVEFVLSKKGNVISKIVDFGRWKIPSLNFGSEY
jgi:hypothetical protein